MSGYLSTGKKSECLGCEACVQVCGHKALKMEEDHEGFRYPILDSQKCVSCGLCNRVCPIENPTELNDATQSAFGGYIKDSRLREESTSGGAFSAIVEAWCKNDYVIFGAKAYGLEVRHEFITDKKQLSVFRKSKYTQSRIGNSYADACKFLKEGKNVLFSGTPCHIAGLMKYLSLFRAPTEKLLTVEVVCEGVPSPLYIRKMNESFSKNGFHLVSLDYRYKDGRRWDFEVMKADLQKKGNDSGAASRIFKTDRWFNPFWSIWLDHLISRPSCYECPYARQQRGADITLGDLWGVHLYCPELYGKNGGSSLAVCNTNKGREAFALGERLMTGHELAMSDALKYQSPMRKPIPMNPHRKECTDDLANPQISYTDFNAKWGKKPTLKLLFQKYVYGNRQKVLLWNLRRRIKEIFS